MKEFGPIVPIVTPCSRAGEPDMDGLRAVCKEMLEAGCKGIFVAGSTGRGPWFSRADREKICRAAAGQINGVVPLIAGVTGSGLPDMLENARAMAEAGAQIAVATVPGYFKYNPKEIETIYLEFADASPLPVMVYDIPEFTNTKLDEGMILRLAKHENIIAFKDSSADFSRFRELLSALEQHPDFLLFQGKENLLFDSLRLGASGFIVSLIHLAPAAFINLYRATRAGDFDTAASIQKRIDKVLTLVRESIEKRPESSTLFHILNYAVRQRGVCENLLLEQDDEPPLWLIQNAQKAVEICINASNLSNPSWKGKIMTNQSVTTKTGDASGRGSVAGFKVNFPARMKPYSESEINAVVKVMRNAQAQTQGAYLRQFEADFKAYTGAKHAFAVDNATNALRLAAILCRLGPGDEVIIPGYTFCATAIPFGMTGAKIVWADMDPAIWGVNPGDIERKITPRTKAIVVVHLLGMPVDMPSVMEIAQRHNLRVVEDCAQAPGAAINGQKVGTFGDFGCFSFHGAKNMTTLGEGGMLTVKSDADAALAPGIRHNGVRPFTGERERYWVPAMSNVDMDMENIWPNNFCLGEAQCALGSELLKTLDQANDVLIAQATKLGAAFADVPELTLVHIPEGYRHVFHQFVMHFDGSAFGKNRNDLLDFLTTEAGIRAIVQYHPLYRYPLFQKLGAGEQDCPVLENWWDNSFSLPWWIGMTAETLDYLADSVKAGIAALKAS